jgi:hypothetical protein
MEAFFYAVARDSYVHKSWGFKVVMDTVGIRSLYINALPVLP